MDYNEFKRRNFSDICDICVDNLLDVESTMWETWLFAIDRHCQNKLPRKLTPFIDIINEWRLRNGCEMW